MQPRQRIALLTNDTYEIGLVSCVLKTRTRSNCEVFGSWTDFKPHMEAGGFDAVLIVNYSPDPERRARLVYAAGQIAACESPVPVAFWDVWAANERDPVAGTHWFVGLNRIRECVEWARCPRGARLAEQAA